MADGEQFNQYTAGPGMYGGSPFLRRNAFDLSGLPGMQGPTGMMASMLLQGLLPQLLGPNFLSTPLVPQGQNLQMHQQVMQFYQQRNASVELAAKQDQDFYYRAIRGWHNVNQMPFGDSQSAAARRTASDLSRLTGTFAQIAPELADNMHGIKGSAAVMAMGVHEAGRMGFDPVTGRMGLSGASSADIVDRAFTNLYKGDTGEAMRRMHGLSQGRAGLAFDEMMRRGLGPSQEDPHAIREALRSQGVNIDKLAKPELESAMRGYQSEKAVKTLKEYSGAIKAVQEIFGDLGHPDAPMSQIFNALNMMTQGGMGRFSPEKLEQSVRETYTISKMTRMGIDRMMGLTGELAQSADRLGLDKSFAIPAAQHAAMAAHVYGASGALEAGGWRRADKDAFARMSGQLFVQAGHSEQAIQLGAVAQLGKDYKLHGEAAALYKAVTEGRSTYDHGGVKGRSVFMSMGNYNRIMTEGGAPASAVHELRMSPFAVEEAIAKNNIALLVKGNQGVLDIDPQLQRGFQGVATEITRDSALAQAIGVAATRGLRGMDQRTLADAPGSDRKLALVGAIRAQLGDRVKHLTDDQLGQVATQGWSRNTQTFLSDPRLQGHDGIINAITNTNPKLDARTTALRQEMQGMVHMQTAVASLGSQPFVAKIEEAMANAKPGDTFGDVISSAIGIRKGDVAKRIREKLERLQAIGKRMDGAEAAGNKNEIESLKHEAETLSADLNNLFDMAPPTGPDAIAPGAGKGAGGAPISGPASAPTGRATTPPVSKADPSTAKQAAQAGDTDGTGRGKMDVTGELRIKWPFDLGSLVGSADPRSTT